jgi:multidrug resistance protein, MATE family
MTLAWKDRPRSELLRLAWPIATSTISYSLMTLVDTLLIARVGRAELAGVALGGLFAFVVLCFGIGLLRAGNTLVAQAVGAQRHKDLPALRGAAVASALGLAVVVVGLGLVAARWLLPHLTATAASGAAASTYLGYRILGAPFVLLYVALRETRYGEGDARSPMVATVVANLVNIGLAVLLIFGLHKGVAGAAVATVIAHAVELLVLGLLVRRRGQVLLARPDRKRLVALWRLGVPIGLQFLLEVGAFALLSLSISLLSEAQMASHQIAIQVIHFSFLPVWAVGEAAAVLAGQAVGADQDDLVLKVARVAAWVSGIYSTVAAAVFALAAPLIVRGFTADTAVTGTAIKLLYVAAVFQVFDAANVVARGILRGAGDVHFAAVVGVVTAWVATPPLAWLLGHVLGLGAFGGWLGLCAEIIVGSAILGVRVVRRSWLPAAARARRELAADREPALVAAAS